MAQAVGGIMLFVGVEWGRRLAIAVCPVNFVVVVWSAFLSFRDESGQVVVGALVNGALAVALLGGTVSSWCAPRR